MIDTAWSAQDIDALLDVLRDQADTLDRMDFAQEAQSIDVVCESLRLARIDRYYTDGPPATVETKPRALPGGPF
jgi:hypothetical protein